jgi:hypothetical protein
MSTRIFHVKLDKHPRAPIALRKSAAAWPQDAFASKIVIDPKTNISEKDTYNLV